VRFIGCLNGENHPRQKISCCEGCCYRTPLENRVKWYEVVGIVVSLPPDRALTIPTVPIWRLTIEQYHQMIDAGILTDDDPVELLKGWLVERPPKTPRHSLSTHLTGETLAQVIPSGWYVGSHEPFTTADSEPEPDVIVVRGTPEDYPHDQPTAADV